MTAGEKILVVGPAWVGDMVMAQSLFKLLRHNNPGAAIDVVAPAWSEPLLARMSEIRRTVLMPVGHGQLGLGARLRIGRAIRAERYDRAIVLPRSLKSALVPFFARVPMRTGFRGELRYGLLNDVRKLDRNRLDQTVKRFLVLGQPPGHPLPEPPAPSLDVDPANLADLIQRLNLSDTVPAVALMPGAAYGPAKCWPLEYFAELAKTIVRAGAAVWVLGSEGERDDGKIICDTAGQNAHNLCGHTRLEDAVDLLSVARVAVTNDSGLMHGAAAAGTQVVAIYGSTSPQFTPPLTKRASVTYLDLDCSPCFERNCPLGHLNCLRQITPQQIHETVSEFI